jgi:sugar lactone lactonase YvrE
MRRIHHTTISLALALAGAATVGLPAAALAAGPPIKEVISSHWGKDVNKKGGNVCTKVEESECQPGTTGTEPGGFQYPQSVAVNNDPASPQHGDVYVADQGNSRVQAFKPSGEFLRAFGVEGAAAGQFASPQGVAVDPSTGNVYVQDFFNFRVQEFTATGEFVLMIGRKVNKKGGNVCTKVEEGECKAGEQSAQGSTEPSAFNPVQGDGDLLAVGGSEHLLYVGDEHRVQEFKADGTWVGEIPLTSISPEPSSKVSALAVDQAGNVYLVYRVNFITNIIREFNPAGKEIMKIELAPRQPNARAENIGIGAIALDAAGRLAVTEREEFTKESHTFHVSRGALYEVGATSLRLITEFANDFSAAFGTYASVDIAFNDKDELYSVAGQEVISYLPLPVGELVTKPSTCKEGPESETSVTFDCVLDGEVNPWNVSATKVWFDWGRTTALGSETPTKEVPTGNTLVPVSAPLAGLLPNETYYDELTGYDENVKPPESALGSERVSFSTSFVAARIVGESSVSYVGSTSAVMFGELNPENANTEYFFEYAPEETLKGCPLGVRRESCPGVSSTPVAQSGLYGVTGTTVEVTGLRPNTGYRYRLFAEDENKAKTQRLTSPVGAEGSFTTLSTPAPEAKTGPPSGVGATSAVVSGMVNPDGPQATYSFELGVYNGVATRYGVVFSGSVAAGTAFVPESLVVTGLQPGTTYAYRIKVASGYGTAMGATATFTTTGLPEVLVVQTPLAMLAIPSIVFPAAVTSKSTTKALTNAQKLAKALKACKKDKSKTQRAACMRRAHKKYPTKQAKYRKRG